MSVRDFNQNRKSREILLKLYITFLILLQPEENLRLAGTCGSINKGNSCIELNTIIVRIQKAQMWNFTKIRRVGVAVYHADRHGEGSSHCSFCPNKHINPGA